MNLSVGIITFNEERDLARTLDAVRDIADEIVIVDSHSTDSTVEIAASYGARVYKEDWKGFGLQKNSLIDKCRGKWILLIDADEEIPEPLRNEIKEIISREKPDYRVYKLRFTTFCFGRMVRHGGWSGFYRVRLFECGAGRYDDREVHENFVTEQPEGKSRGSIIHHTYRDLEDYLNKMNRYTTKSAEIYLSEGKKRSLLSARMSSAIAFFKSYILKRGFMDGIEGLMLAKLNALTTMVKYAKLRQMNKEKNAAKEVLQ